MDIQLATCVKIRAMNPRQCTEYDNINFLMTTTVTTPQNELSGSRLTQANCLYELEKHHRQLES